MKGKRKEFIELLHRYGVDFDKILETEGFDGMSVLDLVSEYPAVLSLYLQKNTSLAREKKSDWIQIRDIYYLEQEFYFDVLAKENGGMDFVKNGVKLKICEELVLLLKDYEFKLLSKLSILKKLYNTLFSEGILKSDLGEEFRVDCSNEFACRKENSSNTRTRESVSTGDSDGASVHGSGDILETHEVKGFNYAMFLKLSRTPREQ